MCDVIHCRRGEKIVGEFGRTPANILDQNGLLFRGSLPPFGFKLLYQLDSGNVLAGLGLGSALADGVGFGDAVV